MQVEPYHLNPPTGVCSNVLLAASRQGDSRLATDVIRVLSNRTHDFGQADYETLIETYVNSQSLMSAFNLFYILDGVGMNISAAGIRPLVALLREKPFRRPRIWSHLNTLREEGKEAPILAINALIEACVNEGSDRSFEEAWNYFEHSSTICSSGPDADTYNLLLKGSRLIKGKSADRAKMLFSEMKALRKIPSAITYNRLILACCKDRDLESAKSYINEMQEAGFEPSQGALNFIEYLERQAMNSPLEQPRAIEHVEDNPQASELENSDAQESSREEQDALILAPKIHDGHFRPLFDEDDGSQLPGARSLP